MAEENVRMNDVNLADIVAMMNNNGGFGGNNGMTWIVFLFFLMAWGGNGGLFGGADSLMKSDLAAGFNFQDINQQLRGITQATADGFCNVNTANLQAIAGLQNQLTSNSDGLASTINMGLANIQQQIMSNRYESMKNAGDIINANNLNTQRILDTINTNQMQQLRDELNATRNTLSNTIQTQNLLGALQPVPRPSYITTSPYAATNTNYCGCGT